MFVLFGQERVRGTCSAKHPKLKASSTFHDCEDCRRHDEKPSQALRRGTRQIEHVEGDRRDHADEADVVVSPETPAP